MIPCGLYFVNKKSTKHRIGGGARKVIDASVFAKREIIRILKTDAIYPVKNRLSGHFVYTARVQKSAAHKKNDKKHLTCTVF